MIFLVSIKNHNFSKTRLVNLENGNIFLGLNTESNSTDSADWALAEVSSKNAHPAPLVWEGDVDELIQTARSQDGGVNDVWSVCGSDDEDVLLAGHSIHLGQDLVDDTIGCSASISNVATTGLSYGVKLVKEQNAWSCLTSLETFTPTCTLQNNADTCTL